MLLGETGQSRFLVAGMYYEIMFSNLRIHIINMNELNAEKKSMPISKAKCKQQIFINVVAYDVT